MRAVGTAARPLARATRRISAARGLTIIGWHRVDGQSDGLSTGVDDFQRHLDTLDEWGATVLPLDAAVAALEAGTLPDRAVALTFDDGYASVVETAWPILRERGLPTTLFVVSDSLTTDLRFAWDRHEPEHDRLRLARPEELVAAAASGLDLGSHTVSHPWLPRLTPDELKRELVDSRVALEELLGRPVTSLAYPTGGWSPAVRAAAADAGYDIAITVDRGLNTRRTPHLSLRRAFVPTEPEDLRLLLDGAYTMLRPLDSWRRRGGPAW
ncbi:polysaccharide deacetylase family protein [Nocardioides sp. URHA0020]|uniref:polysaccharide deacetylase family protein n=1 Tax=Nocardioides sp. URHA0020 TaxID=1380392 RepID=UPI0006873D55|nr:polysaccharide deacetylase family protein [Nocardioides sp. URHA0020]